MTEKAYTQLSKKLKNEFVNDQKGEYSVGQGVEFWIRQCGITCNVEHLCIVYYIFGGVPYVYQEAHRKEILDYLKTCLLYTSPSPRDRTRSRMPSSA